jgi:outer membrane lipoprotein SlyB
VFLGIVGVAEITGVIPGPLIGRPNPPASTAPDSHLRVAKCPLCGTVESVRRVESRGVADFAQHSANGAIAPAGRPEHQAVVPISGAVSQALEEGRSAEGHIAYRVTVRMDDGSYRAISQPSTPTVVVGDRVRVVEGRLVQS